MRPARRCRTALAIGLLALLWVCGLPALARAGPPASAPPQPQANELSLGWTPRLILRRDQIVSPRLYRGLGLAAGALRYDRTRRANAHRLELDVTKATLRSQPDFDYLSWPEAEPATTEGSPLTYLRLRYAYLRELPLARARDRERLALRLGPALDFDVQQLDYVLHPFALGGYHGIFALDARLELELRPGSSGRHRLRAGVSAPLLAWVSRSPYAMTDDEHIHDNRDHAPAKTVFRYIGRGQIHSWNRLQALRLELRYDLQVHEHLALTAGAHARILANSSPRPMLASEYGLTLALTARF